MLKIELKEVWKMELRRVPNEPEGFGAAVRDPRTVATGVRFDAGRQRVEVRLSTGAVFTVGTNLIAEFSAVQADQVNDIQLSPDGRHIVWQQSRVSFPISELVDQTAAAGKSQADLPLPFGQLKRESIYCCAACETMEAGCRRYKSDTYGARTEDYDYD
jgi:hypothetical protein